VRSKTIRNDLPRRMAEAEVTCALDMLTVSDSLAALCEIQARILADHGITPGTPAFDGYVSVHLRALIGRVATLRDEKLAGASRGTH
jgi:hypothetical protein